MTWFFGRVVLRLGVFAFCLMTSVYAMLTCSPFAFDMFVKPLLLPRLGSFITWHHFWFCAAYVVSLVTLPWRLLFSKASRSPQEQAACWLTVAYVAIGAATASRLVSSPVLPTVWKEDGRALPIALLSLLPLMTLAAIDLLTAPAVVWSGGARTATSHRRVLAAFSAAAVYLWALHFARALWQAKGGSVAAWALSGTQALLLSALLFAVLYAAVLLLLGVAARTRVPRAAEIGLTAGALTVAVCEFLRRAVLPTVSLDPRTSGVLALAFAVALVAAWTALAVSRPRNTSTDDWSGLDAILVPQLSQPGLIAGFAAVPVLAISALNAVHGLDWNFVLRRTVLGAEILAIVALMLRATAHVRGAGRVWRAVVAPPLLVLTLFVGSTPLASRVVAWSGDRTLDAGPSSGRQATAEAVFQELSGLLIAHAGVDADYYAFLHDHADFSGSTSVMVPDIDLLAPAAPAVRVGERKPDIFVFAIDSLRRDYLSPYNERVTFTPHIAALAADGFAFQNAFTRHGGTELAITSIWAGASVVRKVRTGGFERMNALEKLVNTDGYRVVINDFTIAEQLRDTTPLTTMDDGVASADTDLCSNLKGLEAELEGGGDARPVLGFFAPMNVHIVNTRNGGQTSLDGDYPGFYAPYASRLKRIDACLGQFTAYLKRHGRYDDSIIVVTSDHGDSLGENGFWGHAMYLFPEDVRVPLIVHIPERLKPQVTTDLARLTFSTDIAPTLYALLGHPVVSPASHFGEPLFVGTGAVLSDRRRQSYLLTSSYGPTYALLRRNGRLMYVSDLLEWREFAYDLSDDPLGARVEVDPELRRLNQRQIRQLVAELSSFYGFSR